MSRCSSSRRHVAFDRTAAGLAVGGGLGAVIAALMVKSLPIMALRWLVAAVALYVAQDFLRNAVLRDFRLEDHPISRVGTHLMWDAGGAVGDDDYSALDLAASFLALTPR